MYINTSTKKLTCEYIVAKDSKILKITNYTNKLLSHTIKVEEFYPTIVQRVLLIEACEKIAIDIRFVFVSSGDTLLSSINTWLITIWLCMYVYLLATLKGVKVRYKV